MFSKICYKAVLARANYRKLFPVYIYIYIDIFFPFADTTARNLGKEDFAKKIYLRVEPIGEEPKIVVKDQLHESKVAC